MPTALQDKFSEDNEHNWNHNTYHHAHALEDYLAWEKEEKPKGVPLYDHLDEEYCESMKVWMKEQGVNMNKPYLILVDW